MSLRALSRHASLLPAVASRSSRVLGSSSVKLHPRFLVSTHAWTPASTGFGRRGIASTASEEAAPVVAAAEAVDAEAAWSQSLGASGTSWRGRARFYREVSVQRETSVPGTWWSPTLDGRPVKSPGFRKLFLLPGEDLALIVAQEFDSQIETLETSTMPVTMLCATVIDVMPMRREETIEELLRYLKTDAVCFPSDVDEGDEPNQTPVAMSPISLKDMGSESEAKSLRIAQDAAWAKPKAHFEKTYGELDVLHSHTLRASEHPKATFDAVLARLHKANNWTLASLLSMAQGCKSLVIALSLLDGALTLDEAMAGARAEETHQISMWGLVEGAHDVEIASVMAQLASAKLVQSCAKDATNPPEDETSASA